MAGHTHPHAKSDRMATHTTGVYSRLPIRRLLPKLGQQIAREESRKYTKIDQRRLICMYCGWVPRHRQWLEEWEGGFVCVSGTQCQQRQNEGGRYYGE